MKGKEWYIHYVMALLEIENLKYDYGDKPLYRNASLKINNGEHCVLVGKNGSGKTTLLNLIVGEIKPDDGKIVWTPNVTFSYLDQQMNVKQDLITEEYL